MSYMPEWILAPAVLGCLALLCAPVPSLVLIAFGVLLIATLYAILAVAWTIAATPYRLVRFARRQWARNNAGRGHTRPTSSGPKPVHSEQM